MTSSSSVVSPIISGTVTGQTTTSQAPVTPFAHAVITDANAGASDTLTITLSGGGGMLADGAGFASLLNNPDGSYTLTGNAAAITSELQALVFTPTAGAPATQTTTNFALSDSTSAVSNTYNATPTVLATFTQTIGAYPIGNLMIDGAGDLFGTTSGGGPSLSGTVFELVKTNSGYSAPVTLANFNGVNSESPDGNLISDALGDLFGTTHMGGTNNDGTVFELVKTGPVYSPPITLDNLNYYDSIGGFPGRLTSDAAGDLFGTTSGDESLSNRGTVFELVKTASGYNAPVILASFNGANGALPSSLTADAAGDLFGITENAAGFVGTVFELIKTGSGYSAVDTLARITQTTFTTPYGNLIADATGDLFGMTWQGDAGYTATVFEMVKTGSGFVAPVTIASFNYAGGPTPTGDLIIDATGDLFGTTNSTVFELVKTDSGYAAPLTLASLDSSIGLYPSGLMVDAAGDLFGTMNQGGDGASGTVFEVTKAQIAAATTTASVVNIVPAPPQLTLTATLTAPTTVALTGTIDLADAGLLISIYDGTTLLGTSTANASGAWNTSVTVSAQGVHTLSAKASNGGGTGASNSVVDLVSASTSLSGGGQIVLFSGAADSVSLSASGGSADTVTGSGGTVNMTAGGSVNETSNSAITVNGSGVTVSAGANDNLGLFGSNDTAALSGTGDGVWVGLNGQSSAADTLNFSSPGYVSEASNSAVIVNGSGVYVSAGQHDNLGLFGAGDTAAFSGAGDGVWVGLNGQSGVADTLNFAASGYVSEASNSAIIVNGSGVYVSAGAADNLGLFGAGDTVTFSGAGDGVWVGLNGQSGVADTLNFAASGYVSEASNSAVIVNGNGVYVAAGQQDNLGLFGAGDTATFSGTGDSVWVGGNGQTGGVDTLTFAAAAGVSMGGDANLAINGAGVTVVTSQNDTLSLNGANDTVVITSGFGAEVIAGFQASGATHDTLQMAPSIFADWAHLLGATKQQGSDLVITLDASDTITLKGLTLTAGQANSFTTADVHFG